MLVLTRRRDERIMIGDDIEVVVVEIRGKQIKLGVVCPPGVRILRKEVWLEIRKGTEPTPEK